MKKFTQNNLSTRSIFTIAGVCFVAVLAGLGSLYQANSKLNNLSEAKAGSGICFQRITQTFTAMMVRDAGSQFLTDTFKSMTTTCLDDLKEAVGESAVMKKTINNLQSDYHWFNQKLKRLSMMNEEVDIYQSNIINKYTELEALKNSLDEQIMGGLTSARTISRYSLAITALGILGMVLSAALVALKERAHLKEISALDAESENTTEAIRRVLEIVNAPRLADSFSEKVIQVEAENHRLEDAIIQMNTMGEEVVYEIPLPEDAPVRDIAAFHESYNNVLDRLQDKAFENGVILDTDLNEEFSVFSKSEPLEQLLLSLFSYSMDQSDRVVIRSRPLGGVAYCKVRIPGFSFSEADIDFLNGDEATEETSLNLILIRELLVDAEAKILVKNRTNSLENSTTAELELIFERVNPTTLAAPEMDRTEEKEVTIVKGNKRQIRAFLDSQISS